MSQFWVDEGFLRQETGLGANERRVNVQASTALAILNGPSGTPTSDIRLSDGVWTVGGTTGLMRNAVATLSSPVNRVTLAGRTWVQITRWRIDYNDMNRASLAQEILDRVQGMSSSGRRIELRSPGPTSAAREGTGRSPRENLQQTAAGQQAQRALTANDGQPVGGTVFLSENLLRAILRTNDRFGRFQINALAGTGHNRPESRHYQGQAVDLAADGHTVRYTSPSVSGIPTVENYLRNTWGFITTGTYSNLHESWFHLEIRN